MSREEEIVFGHMKLQARRSVDYVTPGRVTTLDVQWEHGSWDIVIRYKWSGAGVRPLIDSHVSVSVVVTFRNGQPTVVDSMSFRYTAWRTMLIKGANFGRECGLE